MINSLLEVVNFWNHSYENTYYAINYTLVILMAVAALAAIILVMLQPGNSQGIDALGGTSETFYGKNKGRSMEGALEHFTRYGAIIFMLITLILNVLLERMG